MLPPTYATARCYMILPHTTLQKLENKLQMLQPQPSAAFIVETAKLLPCFC